MTRATKILAATTAVGFATSIWLYLDNRSLRGDRDERPAAVEPAKATEPVAKLGERLDKPQLDGAKSATPTPSLPSTKDESRLERRARNTEELGLKFGRLDGETEEEYRARVLPLISLGLVAPRMRLTEMRKQAEVQAKITPAQSAQLDKAFEKVYDDVLDYTNKAIGDGQLSPYERNVAGWLDYAGGLGGILTGANSQIGKILDPTQVKALAESGFEWGEYLGVNAPWESLKPPPPRPK
ncbi:MAG: hypothetical protein H0V17_17000 [Deltaproteobacteria bacterium]|nr:hypothetical protein [Deltaproteobacteria bacterium]